MRYRASGVPDLRQPFGHLFGRCAILLWTDSDAVHRTVCRRNLAYERRIALLAKSISEPFRIVLVREAAKLNGPHAGRRRR